MEEVALGEGDKGREVLGNLRDAIQIPGKFCIAFVSPLRKLAISQHMRMYVS